MSLFSPCHCQRGQYDGEGDHGRIRCAHCLSLFLFFLTNYTGTNDSEEGLPFRRDSMSPLPPTPLWPAQPMEGEIVARTQDGGMFCSPPPLPRSNARRRRFFGHQHSNTTRLTPPPLDTHPSGTQMRDGWVLLPSNALCLNPPPFGVRARLPTTTLL